jgi:predicted Zn-dependent protease
MVHIRIEVVMKFLRKTVVVILIGGFILGAVFPHISAAITIKEEEELSRQFLKMVASRFEIIDDPMIVKTINAIGKKILNHFPRQTFAYRFYVVKEDVPNAFATPAGHIFMYSGLIAAMEDEDELAGILGHEIAHVYCRHISQKIERSKRVNIATLAGVAAGIFLGAAGGGEAAGALAMGSMAAGQSAMLAYSREDEVQADQVGLEYMLASGYNGEGLLSVLNKIRAQQWYGTDQVPSYLMTHPAVEDRLAYIDSYLERADRSRPQEKVGNSREFDIFHARIVALYSDEGVALNKFNATLEKNPTDPVANYGIGLALARVNRRKEAVEHLKKALTQNAFDPAFLSGLGRVYFLDGRYQEALNTLKSAVSLDPQNGEALFYLGRTQMELGQLQDAENTFENLLSHPPVNKKVNYFIGKAYGMQGNLADAHYHLGLYYLDQREFQSASVQLTKALEMTKDPDRKQEIEKLLKQTQAILSKTKRRSG